MARERGAVTVGDAGRSMTSLPAQILGLRDRGLIREGQWADIVVMDLENVRDMATALEPHQSPEGIVHVLVTGRFVTDNATPTSPLPRWRSCRGPAATARGCHGGARAAERKSGSLASRIS